MNLQRWRSGFLTLALCTGVVGYTTLLTPSLFGQETTGGLQGTVKDSSGAVVAHAQVSLESPSLVGGRKTDTDGKGYYRFANLPPGPYVVKVSLKGFASIRQEGLVIEVGHLPTVDLSLSVGSEATVVEVSATSPVIDVTTVTTLTNVTQDVINYVPRGTSYQSVIQFAPAARNEPLMGNTTTNGSGSVSPGNGSNGGSYGYSVAGGSDSENSYLVEGQETANLIGGYSHTNVPFDFIQEVQIKTSGVAAEYGGSLGGVVNVVMQKGSPAFHGSTFIQYGSQSFNASPSPTSRYDATSSPTATNWAGSIPSYQGFSDALFQGYKPVKSKNQTIFPGFTLGGPLALLLPKALPLSPKWNDRLFFFVGFNPELHRVAENLNYGTVAQGGTGLGVVPFSQNTNTYYTTARIDAKLSERINVFGSWLYQLQKQHGENLPLADSTNGSLNPVTGCYAGATNTTTKACSGAFTDPSVYGHTLGYDAPNTTITAGGDITVTHSIVASTRFGYYFENYHDFGFPVGGVLYQWQNNGVGAKDTNGNALPTSLQQGPGYTSAALDANFTGYNSNKATQFDQDVAWYKSTPFGTHNFKFGYQLVRNSNYIFQGYNEPLVQVNVGSSAVYSPQSPLGVKNCATLSAQYGGCQGQYGYVTVYDFGTGGKAVSYDHGLFAQDSWTVGHGLTLDLGLRIDKEFLPGEGLGGNAPAKPIDFNWGDKIAPRLGVAWDVFHDGKMKVFGSYGVFYDTMKLNLAISSFGGQYWQNCVYGLNTANISSINPQFDANHRYCSGPSTSDGATFATGSTPAGLNFIENINLRAFPTTCSTCSSAQEGVAPGLKPYRQHESVFGVDYQISRTMAIEARYDRRRLDHVIEDSSIYNPLVGETFVVVNPGQGVNATFSGFCNFLYGAGNPNCVSSNGQVPPNGTIAAARSYDGLELRLNKAYDHHWTGMVSYTYSNFRGNYTGLTSSDIADGGNGGRNSPNNSRSFDEPYFQYNSLGGSSSGLLPTDRPSTFKGYAYYRLGYLKRFSTDMGIFQTAYQGSPNTTYANVGLSFNAFPVDIFNRGVWANITQNPNTGAITVGTPHEYRNPWYIQSDFNLTETAKIGESKALSFTATFSNLLNQHAVTAVNEQVDSSYYGNQAMQPGGFFTPDGVPFYAASQHAYSVSDALNGLPHPGVGGNNDNGTNNSQGGPETINSLYGQPLSYQLPRTIRLQAKFTF